MRTSKFMPEIKRNRLFTNWAVRFTEAQTSTMSYPTNELRLLGQAVPKHLFLGSVMVACLVALGALATVGYQVQNSERPGTITSVESVHARDDSARGSGEFLSAGGKRVSEANSAAKTATDSLLDTATDSLPKTASDSQCQTNYSAETLGAEERLNGNPTNHPTGFKLERKISLGGAQAVRIYCIVAGGENLTFDETWARQGEKWQLKKISRLAVSQSGDLQTGLETKQ
jgi:hypothetical protein